MDLKEPADGDQVEAITQTIESQFHQSRWLLLPPILVILMVMMKWPALPALMIATLAGGILAILIQGVDPGELIAVAHYGYEMQSGHELVDELMSRGGLESMMNTVALILCALAFGGLMERIGLLRVLAQGRPGHGAIHRVACHNDPLDKHWDQHPGTGSIPLHHLARPHTATPMSSEGWMPRICPEPSRMGGMMTSALIPWNSCGAFMAATLAVSPLGLFTLCHP